MERRVKLNRDVQRNLFLSLRKILSLTLFSEELGLPHPTMKNYACGDRLLPESLFNKILAKLNIKTEDISFSYLDRYWGAREGGRKAMRTLQQRYPDKLIEWRKVANRNSSLVNRKKITIPLLDEKLAEFIGIYLGDGTLTPYFMKITGDSRYDGPYFTYIEHLILELFGIRASRYLSKKSNAMDLAIHSKELCSFMNSKYGIAYGDKLRNNTLMPEILVRNSSLALACLRGLMDTDGSVSRRGRNGEQFSVSLSSYNPNLISQVKQISDKHQIFTYLSKRQDEIGTNSEEKIHNYFRMVGSSNLRHIVRFHERFAEGKRIYQ